MIQTEKVEYEGIAIRPIPGRPSYWVSECGRIYTEPRPRVRGGWMKLSIHDGGYPFTMGRVGGRPVSLYAHRCVALAWIGPQPEGMEVCHNDSNPLNSHASNLRWDTHRGNMADAARLGTVGRRRG